MKKFLTALLMVFLLAGCASAPNSPADTTAAPTEPEISWVEDLGMAWDDGGALLEVPLEIPDGWHYSSAMEFDGDLLLWSQDFHRADTVTMELCLMELDSGQLLAQKDISVAGYTTPQVMDGALYLCDSTGGRIHKLDKTLTEVQTWEVEPGDGNWYMGGNGILYQQSLSESLRVLDLAGGQSGPLLDGDPEVWLMPSAGDTVILNYYIPATGGRTCMVLDLRTGQIHEPPVGGEISTVTLVDGTWLCGKYWDGYLYDLKVDGGDLLRVDSGDCILTLLEEGYLLKTAQDYTTLALYDLQGNAVSSCRLSANGYYFADLDLIWNESLGGFFLRLYDDGGYSRLLFWDIRSASETGNLPLAQVPEDSEAMESLKARAEQVSEAYGITVRLGEDCALEYDEFSATAATDYDRVSAALDTLESALSVFPEGFIDQLRYGDIHGIRVELVSDLQAAGSGRTGGGYNAFTQPQWDCHLMVVDVDDSYVDTYYHEFSHIIDCYLEWDAAQRTDALFSEEGWAQFNPGWFDGYSYDYSMERELDAYGWFVDTYSTVSPTEDRARVLEYAMSDYGSWAFEDAPGLSQKLDYYCRCIRDAFDTSQWPETVIWEQYL